MIENVKQILVTKRLLNKRKNSDSTTTAGENKIPIGNKGEEEEGEEVSNFVANGLINRICFVPFLFLLVHLIAVFKFYLILSSSNTILSLFIHVAISIKAICIQLAQIYFIYYLFFQTDLAFRKNCFIDETGGRHQSSNDPLSRNWSGQTERAI